MMNYKQSLKMLCLMIVLLSTPGYAAAANPTFSLTEAATHVEIESLGQVVQTHVPVAAETS